MQRRIFISRETFSILECGKNELMKFKHQGQEYGMLNQDGNGIAV